MYVSKLCMLKKDQRSLQRWSRRVQQGAKQSLAMLSECCSKKKQRAGSFDALVPALAQVCICITLGFSGDFVVVVVVVVTGGFPL